MTAKNREVADLIRADIEAGVYAPGDALPGIRALTLKYSTSQGTVASALRRLAGDGWVVLEQGRPTIVAHSDRPTVASLADDVAELRAQVVDLQEWRQRVEDER